MTNTIIDEEYINENTKILALLDRPNGRPGFALGFKLDGVWWYQVLMLRCRGNKYLPHAARLYRRIKHRDDIDPFTTFRECAL